MARRIGFYISAQKRNRKAELEAMRAAAKELDAMIESWGDSEEDLMKEYKRSNRRPAQRSRMPGEALILDAIILIRAVLGKRVS
jgi:hypothetical protein